MLSRLPALALVLCITATPLFSVGAVALPSGPFAGQLAGAPARATAAELKAAQASVDAALKLRKQRLESWQKAAKAKEAGAAEVARKKKAGVAGDALEDSLKRTLVLDEEAAGARAALLAAEADVAKGGAALLKLYDALLVERRRAIDALPAGQRASAAQSYRELTAQRDAVRKVLQPVLGAADASALSSAELPRGVDLDARADDDVETLLEKADLARDLEARFLRQAEAVRRRILELEEEQAVAREVSGMIGRSQLFDEEDRRLMVTRSETTRTPASTGTSAQRGSGPAPAQESADDTDAAFDGAPEADGNSPPPAPPPTDPSAGAGGPPPAALTPSSPAALVTTTTVRGEQGFGPQADATMQGLLTSSSSVESLKALEAKLKAQAQALKAKSSKLKSEAQNRARD